MLLQAQDITQGTITVSQDTTLTPTANANIVIDTEGVTLTIDDCTQAGVSLNVTALESSTLEYTAEFGNASLSMQAETAFVMKWVGSFWSTSTTQPITGIDDNGQPFAFNIGALTNPEGVINLTGTDANGNPFDYGLGKLVVAADENNIVTGQEIKTSKTFNGKPVYKLDVLINNLSATASTTTVFSLANISNLAKTLYMSGAVSQYIGGVDNGTLGADHYNAPYTASVLFFSAGTFSLSFNEMSGNTRVLNGHATIEYTKTSD